MSVRARCCSSSALTRPLTPEARRKLEEGLWVRSECADLELYLGFVVVVITHRFHISPPSGHWDGSRLVVEVQVNFYGFTFDEFQKNKAKK